LLIIRLRVIAFCHNHLFLAANSVCCLTRFGACFALIHKSIQPEIAEAEKISVFADFIKLIMKKCMFSMP
jgi:hypothetical protein